MHNKNIVAIVQARCGSTRFPNKVFADLSGKPLIWHVIQRLKFANTINDIILATTTNSLDDKLYKWAKNNKIKVFRGNENNVLNRFAEASKYTKADIIIRITADDPFKDPRLIDEAVNKLISERADFVCNNNPPTYPEGLDVEVFTKDAILLAEKNAISDFEKEHVTQYFYHHPNEFKIINLSNKKNQSYLRWTIDTKADLEMARKIYEHLYKNDYEIFYMEDILYLLEKKPEIATINKNIKRSAMYDNK